MTALASPGATGTGRGSRARSRGLRSSARALPLLPAALLLAVFLLGPILVSLWGSLTNATLSGSTAVASDFIGLDNYTRLFEAPDFPVSVINTIVFVFFSAVIGQNILGLALALMMRSGNRIITAVVGTIVVTAWVLPEIVAAFAAYAFFRDNGTMNAILAFFGVEPVSWLFTMPVLMVILANIWRGTAFSMMVYSAALADVPPEITEAAEVDGASGIKRLFLITIPMIRSTIGTNSMIVTLQTLSVFTLIFVMTGGGPGNKSTTLPILAYQQGLKFGELGYGTAIATIMLLIGAVFSFFYVRALREEVSS